MSKRNLILFLLIAVAAVVIILLLKPCGPGSPVAVMDKPPVVAATPPATAPVAPPVAKPAAPRAAVQAKTPEVKIVETPKTTPIVPADKTPPIEKNIPPAAHEVDTTPPVDLTGSEVLPEVARCATANFPAEAKPFVKMAVVTVRLVVDKFGNVREDKPLAVEFPQEVDEEQLPAMRKLFIKAGARAFGAKKCPPHIVNGQNVGYAIEVPLQYKH